jgi:phosphomannomutase
MSESPLMLGVSGLRGIVGKSLTPEVARAFARAFGSWVMEQSRKEGRVMHDVIIGRDGRAGGETIHEAAIEGLLDAGCDVRDIGIAMTPTVAHTAWDNGDGWGMVVTASHNPQEWNGLKCIVRHAAPPPEIAQEIIERFKRGRFDLSKERGKYDYADTLGGSEHCILVALDLEPRNTTGPDSTLSRIRDRKFKVALDSVNASGGAAGASLLCGWLGCELTHLNAEPTGIFPHTPEPVRENLTGLCTAVRDGELDIGFAQDPDGDRLAIVDERGHYIGEEYTLAFAAESVLTSPAKRPGEAYVMITNLSTSRMIDDIAARHGARVVRTAVGEANVAVAMRRAQEVKNTMVLGGEGNGGVIWPGYHYVRDSLAAMALVLALMARTGKTVSRLVADIPAYAIEKRKVDLARKEDAKPAVERIAKTYRDQRVDLQDGVRIDWDSRKAWLHVRASNTEPIMRLIAEAPTAAEAKRILDEAAKVIG